MVMTDCIEYPGYKNKRGYGQLTRNGKSDRAHRLAWAEKHGPIPDGLCVLHKCDNPPCVNVEHLFLGTRADNIADMHKKGRARKARGVSHGNSVFSNEDIRRIREAHLFGARQVDLAAAYGVHQTAISAVTRRRWWAHVD